MCSRWEVEGAEADEFENVRDSFETSKLLGMLSSDNDIFWTRELIGLVDGARSTSATPTVASSANISISPEPSALLIVVSDLFEKKPLRAALAGLGVIVLGCKGKEGV